VSKRTLLLFIAATAFAAQVPKPALLVLNKDDATLSIIDPRSGKTVGTVPTGEAPHELAVSPDGKLAFAANYGSRTPGNSISVIDVAGQKELRRFNVSPLGRPHGVWAVAGKVYFTAEANKIVGRYDPVAGKIDWMIGTGQNSTHMVTVSENENRFITANIGSDSISIFERSGESNWNQAVVPVGKGPEGFDLSPDGKHLWAANSRDGGVSIVDLASKQVVQTLDAKTKRSNRLKFTPDGKHVLISDLAGDELVIFDADSRRQIKRIKIGKSPEGILMEPDGSRAYIAVSGENHLAILDLGTLEVIGKIETGRSPDGMAWVR
jgi:YVTN family beta-propeller protein